MESFAYPDDTNDKIDKIALKLKNSYKKIF